MIRLRTMKWMQNDEMSEQMSDSFIEYDQISNSVIDEFDDLDINLVNMV